MGPNDPNEGRRKVARQESAGGVVYKKDGNKVRVCLLSKRAGRVWAFPKGRVNEGETLQQTAHREILEETGHKVEVGELLDEINYYFFLKETKTFYHKTVYFFLLRLVEADVQSRDHEADEVRWFDLGEARKKLSYLNEKRVLKKAEGILKLVH